MDAVAGPEDARTTRWRFRIRLWLLLIVVALVGLALSGLRTFLRFQASRSVQTRVYELADLASDKAAVEQFIPRAKAELAGRDWVEVGDGESIVPFYAGGMRSLVIRSNKPGHDRIVAMLRRLRTAAVGLPNDSKVLSNNLTGLDLLGTEVAEPPTIEGRTEP